MRLMAVAAVRLASPEAGGASKCLHDECGFAEPAINVERTSGDFGIRAAQISWWKSRLRGLVIHFAVRAGLTQRGLGMALAADGDISACLDGTEIHHVSEGARCRGFA